MSDTDDRWPNVRDRAPRTARPFTVRSVEYDGGEPVLALEPRY
jgi:hypothetical protein